MRLCFGQIVIMRPSVVGATPDTVHSTPTRNGWEAGADTAEGK